MGRADFIQLTDAECLPGPDSASHWDTGHVISHYDIA